MSISIIIPTYNGATKLPGILEALAHQTVMADEIIVAVDGSSDNTLAVLTSFQSKLPALKILTRTNSGRSVIRNSGAAEAIGDLLVFFDDDMLPTENCVEEHMLHQNAKADSILTGAQVDIAGKERTEIQNYKASLSLKWSRPLLKTQGLPLKKEQFFLTAANFSIAKKLFIRLGGFDETLTDAEDFDLAVRALKEGIMLYYNHRAFAWHDDKINSISYIKRQRQYMAAHKKLSQLKPWMVEEGFIKPLTEPSGFKKNIYGFFSSRAWIEAVDKGYLRILPQKLRYKIYDLVITSNSAFFPEIVKLS
jgi:glycosyltransferase involved in cell wall biosynthesis